MGLVLSRREGEAIRVGDDITVQVASIGTDDHGEVVVKLRVSAPASAHVDRLPRPKDWKPHKAYKAGFKRG